MQLHTGGSLEKTVATIEEEGRYFSVFVVVFFVGLVKSETIRFVFFEKQTWKIS